MTPKTGPARSEACQAAADEGLGTTNIENRLKKQFLEQKSTVYSLTSRIPADSREDL